MQLLYIGPPEFAAHVRAQFGPHTTVHAAAEAHEVDTVLSGCAAIVDASMRVRFDAARIARASALRVYSTATTGADHVDERELAARGIPLLTLRGQREVLSNLTPAAELSWLLLMACARGLPSALADPLEGTWERSRHPGIMLRGKTLGLVGCGRIGQWMARYANAFGMSVIGHDPHLPAWPEGIEPASLDEVFARADFVSVHVGLDDSTRGLVDRRLLSSMKRGAIFINTSRGEIVDESALLDVLSDGTLRAAGVDVLTGEPEIKNHPLVAYAREHPNLLITPHIGGFSPDAVREVLTFACGRVREVLGADPP